MRGFFAALRMTRVLGEQNLVEKALVEEAFGYAFVGVDAAVA
jgi:hypothetical protein